MAFFHVCGKPVEADWAVCPFCSASLVDSSEQELPSENMEPTTWSQLENETADPPQLYQQNAPQYVPQIQQPVQQQYQPQVQITTPQYTQQPMQQQFAQQYIAPNPGSTLRYQRKKGGNGAVVAIVAVIVLIVMFSVVYVLIQSSSKATWSGEIDSRMIDVKWYNSTGEWEMWESSGAFTASTDGDSEYAWLENYDSFHAECQVSSSTTYCEIDVEDWIIQDETFNVDYDVKSQLLGDVLFAQITWMQIIYEDGDTFSESDPFNGECVATVHEDVYDGWYSWRNAVNNVNSTYGGWPSWCNSVEDY